MKLCKKIFWLTTFSIAMGFLEAIVVVYLRVIYYPGGFEFPIQMPSNKIFLTEVIREICTIVMLLSIAVLIGKNKETVFAWFIMSFGIWDIFYYIALKLFLDWPASLLTWDILFLIPVTWLGPVLAPILCSITMILLASVILYYQNKNGQEILAKKDTLILIIGAFLIFVAFTWNYTKLLISYDLIMRMFVPGTEDKVKEIFLNYVPGSFFWELFSFGIMLIYFELGVMILKCYQKNEKF
ncbi:MAG: hypothetical protein ACLFQM_08020 [Fidelibacterota bacterium]